MGDDIAIIHVDDQMLVLDKPAGMLSVPGRGEEKQDCLSARAQALYPDALVVHRLDMATSGLMVMARSAPAQRQLSQAFAARAVVKCYVAVVDGRLSSPADEWQMIDLPIQLDWAQRPLRIVDPVQGKSSQTRWRTLAYDSRADTTRVELQPITGRSHQLRVHLQAQGHPILGDRLYASPRVQALSGRMLLHASTLTVPHPQRLELLRFDSPVPF